MSRNRNKPTILIVDDDPKIAAFVGSQLRSNGYHPDIATDGQEGLDKAAMLTPSLVILDLSLPVLDGIEVLKRLREWFEGPIIILSATDEEQEKVSALDLGADDYLTKPFGTQELLARVRVALRRADRLAERGVPEKTIISAGPIRIDLVRRVVTVREREVYLTHTEYELFRYLASNAGKVLTHREILQHVWGPEYGQETEYLRTFIKQLRRKLESDPSRPMYLVTQPGIGYRLAV